MSNTDDVLNIGLTNTPLDDPDKMAEAAELFRAIGLATSSWGRLETQIDMVLLYLNRPGHSSDLFDPDHPIGFKSKIKLLKRWFNKHPALSSQAESLRTITPTILRLSSERNKFLHSVLSDYQPETGRAVWRGIRPAGVETFNVGMHVGSVAQLIAFAAEAHSMHVQFAKTCRELFDSGMIEQLKKSSPHIPRLARLFRRLRANLGF